MKPKLRLPAEWEPHGATWLAWPPAGDWPGKHRAACWGFTELVRLIGRSETVRLAAAGALAEQARQMLTAAGVGLERVDIVDTPVDRSWMRDNGPCFVRRDAGSMTDLVVAGFAFTAWARYANWRSDTTVPQAAAEHLGLEFLPVEVPETGDRRVVLEGGAIEVNGQGTLITTEECLLHPRIQVRNPGFSRADYEALFARWLGCPEVIWLGNGIAGDDTHGHVDDFCRFVNPATVVLAEERNPDDVNYRPLAEAAERLQGLRLADGRALEVVRLPMPEPVSFGGQRLPASYANFSITNASVLVPVFNDPADHAAVSILSELFPDHEVLGVYARDLVLGRGGIHCLTRQEPVR